MLPSLPPSDLSRVKPLSLIARSATQTVACGESVGIVGLAMSGAGEEPLPLYGLPDDWPDERRLRSHGGQRGREVLDIWSGSHCVPGSEGAIVVCSQRRAIHGGPAAGSPRVTGPEHLIRFDAALEAMLTAHEDELAALRRTSGRPAMDRLVYELDEAAQRIGHDAASWQASQLTIDGTTVEAIEMTHDGWWLVLHIGIGEVADVYVFGPPGARPTTLVLQSISAAAYQ